MGTINLIFEGVCTHISREINPELPPHRVILIRSEEGRVINGQLIPAHFPLLTLRNNEFSEAPELACIRSYFANDEITTVQLEGVTVDIPNATGTLDKTRYLPSIPKLKQLTPLLGPPVADLILNGAGVAAYVDLTAGVLVTKRMMRGALYVYATITTNGDPQLRLTCFPGGGTTITLNDNATVLIANREVDEDSDRGGTTYDFLIHYLISGPNVPPSARVPGQTAAVAALDDVPTDDAADERLTLVRQLNFTGLGPGCSNSNYP